MGTVSLRSLTPSGTGADRVQNIPGSLLRPRWGNGLARNRLGESGAELGWARSNLGVKKETFWVLPKVMNGNKVSIAQAGPAQHQRRDNEAQAEACTGHLFPQGPSIRALSTGVSSKTAVANFSDLTATADLGNRRRWEPASAQSPKTKAHAPHSSQLLAFWASQGGLLAQHHLGLEGQINSILPGHLWSHHPTIPPGSPCPSPDRG